MAAANHRTTGWGQLRVDGGEADCKRELPRVRRAHLQPSPKRRSKDIRYRSRLRRLLPPLRPAHDRPDRRHVAIASNRAQANSPPRDDRHDFHRRNHRRWGHHLLLLAPGRFATAIADALELSPSHTTLVNPCQPLRPSRPPLRKWPLARGEVCSALAAAGVLQASSRP